LFARIPSEERERLFALLEGVTTVGDLVERLGKPNSDSAQGVVVETPEREGKAPTIEARRVLVYSKLSEVADVYAEVYPNDRVALALQGKYMGRRDGAA
jgi:hypothetical protein